MSKKFLSFVLLFLLLLSVLVSNTFKKMPSGGELCASDFNEGYLLYAGSVRVDPVSKEVIRDLYQITDETISAELFDICSNMNGYREIDAAKDIMLAGTQRQEELGLYFLAPNYCCKIIPILWENYASPSWRRYPIKQERGNQPTLMVWRIDLREIADEDLLSYVQNFQGKDSLNSEGGRGWYAILTEDLYEKLLALLLSARPA